MLRLAFSLLILSVGALLVPAASLAYSWPLRPFYEPHAVRGYFNDPRLWGDERGFHFGIDISAADLTPVYAVMAGRASARGHTVSVFPLRGHVLSYWHVMPAVRTGQRVRRHQIVGYVEPRAGHLHFAEYGAGTYWNPLRIGGVAPYLDDTVPKIPAVTFSKSGVAVRPELLTGAVDIAVDAYDTSPRPLPPEPWARARLAPALIRWRIVQDETTIRPWQTAVDFRTVLMSADLFSFIYAPGTVQNRPDLPGRYEFYVAHALETAELSNGSYALQVEALDTQENLGDASFAFTVEN